MRSSYGEPSFHDDEHELMHRRKPLAPSVERESEVEIIRSELTILETWSLRGSQCKLELRGTRGRISERDYQG